MKITFDFDKNEISYKSDGQEGTQYIPNLNERQNAILEAAELELIPGEEIRSEINAFFEDMGANIRCAEPPKKEKELDLSFTIRVLDQQGRWYDNAVIENDYDAIRIAMFYRDTLGYSVQLIENLTGKDATFLIDNVKIVRVTKGKED